MAIQAKKKPVIKKGSTLMYSAENMAKYRRDNFIEVDDPKDLLKIINPISWNGTHLISFDTETHPYFTSSQDVPASIVRRWVGKGKNAIPQDFPFIISVCDGVNAVSIRDTVDNGFKKFLQLRDLFEDPLIDKVAHNTKFDMHQFANINMRINGRLHDSIVLCKLTDENRRSFELKEIAGKHPLGHVAHEYMLDDYKTTNRIKDYRQFPNELIMQYANADVWNAIHVFIDEYKKLVEEGLVDIYNTECGIMLALYEMERYGMHLDTSYEKPLKENLQDIKDAAESEIYNIAGRIFNINSGAQIYSCLMEQGIDPAIIPKTDKGNPKLDKDVLAMLGEKHGVKMVSKILEFKAAEKLLTTYAVGIYDQRDALDRVHGNINQTEATTGRMSITKPALQTLPKKDKRIRKAMIPEDDYEMWFMDLDQVEYRLFAHYAKIPSLIEAIKLNHDVHGATAVQLYERQLMNIVTDLSHNEEYLNSISTEARTALLSVKNMSAEILDDLIRLGIPGVGDYRAEAKTANFALLYGVGVRHLSEILDCSQAEARRFKYNYFAVIPEAEVFINTVHQVIKYKGFVKNFYGRRRRLGSDSAFKAPNALIQGCAADYIKAKMYDIYKYIKYNNLKSRMIMVVHDEILFLVHKDEKEHVPYFRWLLSDFTTFRCPITAGCEVGNPSWGEKVDPGTVDFLEPEDKSYLDYNVFDGSVFLINKEVIR